MFFADYYSLFIQILSCSIVCICNNQDKVCIFLACMHSACVFVQGGVCFFIFFLLYLHQKL